MTPFTQRGRGTGHGLDPQTKAPSKIATARLAGILLLAASQAALFAQDDAAPARRPQFRTGSPAPVLDQTTTPGTYGAGYTGTEGLTNVPPGSFEPDRVGIPQSTLFRDTHPPYSTVNLPAVGPNLRSENVTGTFHLALPSLYGGLPWAQRGFEPQDADLKLGPLFFKLREIDAAVLHSDNINLTPDHTESGTIAMVAATIDVIAQITEGLRLASSATFVYFPIEGKAGIAGFGLTDIYNFGLFTGPIVRTQVTWDTEINDWHVVFADEFRIEQGTYSIDYRSDNALFEGFRFDEASQAGRYVFRPTEGFVFGKNENRYNHDELRSDLLVYSNLVSADAEKITPGVILMRARVYREDLWYNQGNRGLPSLREGATLTLVSERENMRFKPYFVYDAYYTDEADNVQHIFRGGIFGPITDQLILRAEAGYFIGGLADESALWNVELNHVAGPYTTESLFYGRNFNYFHDEIDDVLGYNLHQVIGPRVNADFYATKVRAEEYYGDSSQNTIRDEYHLGLRLIYNVGPRTSLGLTGEYTDVTAPDETTWWIGRAELGYNFTDTLNLHFVYQYQKRSSNVFQDSYTENLFFLSLSKYFP